MSAKAKSEAVTAQRKAPDWGAPERGCDGLRPSWIKGAAVALLTIAVVTLALEGLIRLVAPQNLNFYNYTTIKRPSGFPWKPFTYIPGGYNPSYIGVPVKINQLGLRDSEITLPKPPCTYRIIALGDSVVFGFGVKLQDTFVKQLERQLNQNSDGQLHYEVINAGVEATGLDYYRHFVASSAAKLQPNLLLLGVTLNDIANYSTIQQASTQRLSLSQHGEEMARTISEWLFLHSELYLWAYMDLKSTLYRLRILKIDDVHHYDFLPLQEPSPEQDAAWSSSYRMLSGIVEEAKKDKLPMVVVVFPEEVQLSRASLDLYREKLGVALGPQALQGEPQRRLRAFFEARGIQIIDPAPAFRAAKGVPLFLRNAAITVDPVHPSAAGHRLIAHAIYQRLNESSLLERTCEAGKARLQVKIPPGSLPTKLHQLTAHLEEHREITLWQRATPQ